VPSQAPRRIGPVRRIFITYRRHRLPRLKPGEAAALGAVGGLLVGTIIANSSKQQVQPAPSTGLPMQHYVWCDAKYKTYVIATNTYTGYDMKPHYCVSPYVY